MIPISEAPSYVIRAGANHGNDGFEPHERVNNVSEQSGEIVVVWQDASGADLLEIDNKKAGTNSDDSDIIIEETSGSQEVFNSELEQRAD